MFCTKCGKEFDDDLRFCTACGAPVQKPNAAADEAKADAGAEAKAVEQQATVEQQASSVGSGVEPADSTEVLAASEPADSAEGTASEIETDESDTAATEVLPATEPETEVMVATPAVGIGTTKKMDAVEASAAAESAQDASSASSLPDSALEPSTPAPYFESRPHDYGASTSDASGSGDANPPHSKKRRNRLIAGGAAAAAVIVIVAIVLFLSGVFSPDTPIDTKSFPNDVIRTAVEEQLDTDGDGKLSSEEASSVTALVYTNEGAQFVTGDEEIDIPQIRQQISERVASSGSSGGAASSGSAGSASSDAASSGGAAANGGSVGQADDSAASANTTLPDLEPFSHMTTFVATDTDISSIALDTLPDLEYVDLRGNANLKELDLSKNSNLTTLYCDPEVTLTGLDEAGLYFTDLITHVSGGSNAQDNIAVEYDTHGRPIKVDDTTYVYDDQGRLIETKWGGTQGWSDKYTYGDNGLLTHMARIVANDAGSPPEEFAYGYDEKGRLTQLTQGRTGEGLGTAGVFNYEGDDLVSYQGSDAAIAFTMDDAGKMVSALDNEGPSQEFIECAYDASGLLTKYGTVSTAYSEAAAPTKTVDQGEVTTYACNSDGYVTEVSWGNSFAPNHATITYVKRVGSLEDRAADRYVPVFKLGYSERLLGSFDPSLYQSWFANTGSMPAIFFFEHGPQTVSAEQAGIIPNLVSNANEEKLAAYDREHWTDGLNLSGAQPITGEEPEKLLAQATALDALPVSAADLLNDPVYGQVVKEYQQYVQSVSSATVDIPDNTVSQYPDISQYLALEIADRVRYTSNQDRTMLFALMDLDQDGRKELLVTLPTMLSSGDYNDRILAVYAEQNGKPKCVLEAGQGNNAYVTADGGFVFFDEKAEYAYYRAVKLVNDQLEEVAKFSYEMDSSATSVVYKIVQQSAGGEAKTERASLDQRISKVNAFLAQYPQAFIPWTPVK